MFVAYIGETYRTGGVNIKLGLQDMIDGTKGKKADPQLFAHGLKRVAGALAVITQSKVIIASAAMRAGGIPALAAMGMYVLGHSGDEEKDAEEKTIQAGLGDAYDGHTLLVLERGEDGRFTFLDLDRFDPYQPLTSVVQPLLDGDYEEALESAKELWPLNTVASRLSDVIYRRVKGRPAPKPNVGRKAPEAYSDRMADATSLFGHPRLLHEIAYLTEPFTFPGGVGGVVAATQATEEEMTPIQRWMNALSLRPVEYDPERVIRAEYGKKYAGPVDEAKDELRTYMALGDLSRPNLLREYVTDTAVAEYRGYLELKKAVDGALAAGMDESDAKDALEKSGADKRLVRQVFNGEFSPNKYSDEFFEGIERGILENRKATQEARDRADETADQMRDLVREYREELVDSGLFGE